MKFPRYWARGEASGQSAQGRRITFQCWGWSDESHEAAVIMANDRALAAVNKAASGADLNRYPYGVRPMREEIIERIIGRHGEEAAVITRNGYGALVLNAARAMFMDVDLGEEPKKKKSGPGFIERLFGTKKPPQDTGALAEPGMADVERWCGMHRDLSLRVYRTRAGLRCLVTSHLFDPADPKVERLMNELNCDPLYVRLCKQQECFRARLTPKPWRCGLSSPPSSYPFLSDRQEKGYRKWVQGYETHTAGYDVCRLVTSIGSTVHPDLALVIEVHDKYCCRNAGAELA